MQSLIGFISVLHVYGDKLAFIKQNTVCTREC